jgi:hypothetical protein
VNLWTLNIGAKAIANIVFVANAGILFMKQVNIAVTSKFLSRTNHSRCPPARNTAVRMRKATIGAKDVQKRFVAVAKSSNTKIISLL